MKNLRLISNFFIIGFLIPCLAILCISSGLGAPAILFYFIGTILPSAVISLLIGIVTFLKSKIYENKSYKLKVKSGLISLTKTFLVGMLLPSIIVAPLLLNNWAGITYIVNLDIWGPDFCRVDILNKCRGTGYSSLWILLLMSFIISTIFSLTYSIVNYRKNFSVKSI